MALWSIASDPRGRRRMFTLLGLTAAIITAVAMVWIPHGVAVTRSVVQPDPTGQLIALPSPRAGPTRPIRLVVLGDSVASGAGCACVPFGSLLAKGLGTAAGHAVPVANAAQDGLTTNGLLQQLSRSDVDRSLADATLVTVTIGANDFDPDLADHSDCLGPATQACYRARLASLGPLLQQALGRIRVLAPASQILVTGYWNVFLDGAVGRQHGATYVQVSDGLTRTVNTVLAQESQRGGATYIDLYSPFEQRPLTSLTALLAADGDHPSAAGHQLISAVLLAVIQSRAATG